MKELSILINPRKIVMKNVASTLRYYTYGHGNQNIDNIAEGI